MYSKVSEFLEDWRKENETTLKILSNLTDDSLKQRVTSEGRDIAYIAWHIVITIGEMMNKSGLNVEAPAEDSNPPATASEIAKEYDNVSISLYSEVESKWSDEMMNDELEIYGEKWKRSLLCTGLIKHEIHHRAQLTILMRQAGLKVPGAYGPSKEEWGKYGMPEAR
jgi:uncharacterized damage-inducible protein DinB